jgi:hypothetical protein
MGLIGAPTYPMLRDAAQTALIEVLDRNRIPYEWNRSESYLLMKETHSKILLRAVDEFERLRGSNLAWFGIDELTYAPEAAWLRLEGRLRDPKATRLCGFGVWTPKGYDWVHRRFIAERVEGRRTHIRQCPALEVASTPGRGPADARRAATLAVAPSNRTSGHSRRIN